MLAKNMTAPAPPSPLLRLVRLCLSERQSNEKFFSQSLLNVHHTSPNITRKLTPLLGDREIDQEAIALFERLNINSYEELIKSMHLTIEDTILYNTSLIFSRGRHCSFSRQTCTLDDLKLVWQMDGSRSCVQFNSYHPNRTPRAQTTVFSPFR